MISLLWRRCAREMMMCDLRVGFHCPESCQQCSVQTKEGEKLEFGGFYSHGSACPVLGGSKQIWNRR